MSTKPTKGLGRGFGSLIPQNFDQSLLVDSDERVQKLSIDAIAPNSDQPRQTFDETALQELAGSIKQHGILLPLVVTDQQDGTYRIIAGERRWRAARIAKLTTVPAIVRSLKELEQLEIALVENVQRVDLAPLEQAISVEKLHQQFSLPYDTIAKRLGKAPSTVANIVRLLNLPDAAKDALNAGTINEGHARALLAIREHPEQQAHLFEAIVANGWSVRQAERYVAGVKAGVTDKAAVVARVDTENDQTKALGKRLKTAVHIRRTARGGRLEISFKDDDELERIIKSL